MSFEAASHPVRPITDGEVEAFTAQIDLGFHENPPQEAHDLWMRLLPRERSVAAFDGDELVSTGGSFPFAMTVPGGTTVPTAGVTMITVKPTHRRRGILTAMMRHQLHGWHERGEEPVATLQASEPAIYGRFGYGLATQQVDLKVPRGDNGLSAVPGSDKFRLRMLPPTEAYDRCQEVFEANRLGRPGMLPRVGEGWRDSALADDEFARDEAGPLRCVLAEDADGRAVGFARYRVKEDFDNPAHPDCKVRVQEVYGRDLASYVAMWRFLLDLDLTSEVHASVPVDDPLMYLLTDTRRSLPQLRDDMYLRLVDVDRALAARRYSGPVDVVLEVADSFCPWNAGRWRLRGDADGAVCERTTDPADLVLGVRELGSAYLGGLSLSALARAGRVEELRAGTLAAASRAFVSDVAPWLPFGF
ncbi:GNAT family N-acetyltransferase [Catenulispora rubra]|uniref:GNAT family N-acetyltransferase n=1 Tax=Catenulispora rubra TaxID=280293 RepID=UPI0018927BDF|nr:GNAT family N-acetyltransferase [Catenulispora rubra]